MALPKSYSAINWYWKIGGSTTQVWSSASLTLVAVTDSTYVAWHAANTPTSISSAGQLVQVMFQQVEPYVMSLGIPVTSSGTSALNATYSLADAAFSRLNTVTAMVANSKGLPGGGGTFLHPDVSGNYKTFTSTNILNLTAGLQTFRYVWEQAIITRISGGSASIPASVTIA